jgi:hypothetical protein
MCVLRPHRLDQIGAQCAQRRGVQQHHAPLTQQDRTRVYLEAQKVPQVFVRRVIQVIFHKVIDMTSSFLLISIFLPICTVQSSFSQS